MPDIRSKDMAKVQADFRKLGISEMENAMQGIRGAMIERSRPGAFASHNFPRFEPV